MRLIKNVFTLPFLMLVACYSCVYEEEYAAAANEIVFSKSDSPYHIKEDVIIDSAFKLVVLPGSELVFHDSTKILINGSIHIQGNAFNQVILRPYKADSLWGGIKILQPDDSCIIEGAVIRNGLVYAEDANVRISNCSVYNTFLLEQFDALIRLFRGSIRVNDSYFESNHTGEGILIHKTKENSTIVENCEFHGVPDAVEYLNVHQNGIIRNNIFFDIQQELGDGIDLNGCRAILIENNYFENIRDFGIETGNDKYGPSKDILICKNIFVNCYKGVVVKGGSSATLVNNTFYKNTYGVGCMVEHYGSNYDPNRIEVINSIFSKSVNDDFLNNENSTINFSYCLSDRQLLQGERNINSNPLFIAPERKNFRLNEKSPCIGKGDSGVRKKYNVNCLDLGAICYGSN